MFRCLRKLLTQLGYTIGGHCLKSDGLREDRRSTMNSTKPKNQFTQRLEECYYDEAVVDKCKTSRVHEEAGSEQQEHANQARYAVVCLENHPVLSIANLQSVVDSWSVTWALAIKHPCIPRVRIAWKLSLKYLNVLLRTSATRLIQSQQQPYLN